MSIPEACSVLVIGGGPGGSFAAAALAREGVNTVCLEADVFPRYHIGESMLASFRVFMRFIGLESTFEEHGFMPKLGASFKMTEKREGYTDFVAVNGPQGYSWNVIRSESDEILFKHAAKCGAHTFDGTAVKSIEFDPSYTVASEALGRPISAMWSRKDGTSGKIKFDYLIDASGRAGIVSTKYMKNRKFNKSLKNSAAWAYWKNVKPYSKGTPKEGQPFFESLSDGSGWIWNIPLHNGTMSIGVVMRQSIAEQMKKGSGASALEAYYEQALKLGRQSSDMRVGAERVSEVKSAADWSYSASTYASKYIRIVGDAGCFIDPYFSSGVHLALSSALSAAVTIQASRNGECDEETAAKWHDAAVKDGYHRFLAVVIAAARQIRDQKQAILNHFEDDGFDHAFSMFRPVIQGTADADFDKKLDKSDVVRTIDFCESVFRKVTPEEQLRVMEKLAKSSTGLKGSHDQVDTACLTSEEQEVWNSMKSRELLDFHGLMNTCNLNTYEGYVSRVVSGNLGLTAITNGIKA